MKRGFLFAAQVILGAAALGIGAIVGALALSSVGVKTTLFGKVQ